VAAGKCTAPEGTEEYTRVQEAAKAYILNLFKSKYTETEKKVRSLWPPPAPCTHTSSLA
jgi:hypothetical protein